MEQNELSLEDLRQQVNEQSFLGKFIFLEYGDQEQPIPFVCVVYNNKYPGFYYQQIIDHFIRYFGTQRQQLWLSYENKPIQWHIPFFVSIDKINEEIEIQVHIKKRPETVLAIHENIQLDIKNRYFWNLKQACMIRYGYKWEKQIFQTITIEQQYQMFQYYSDHNVKLQFYEYFDKIWDMNILKKETTINIPTRIFIDNLIIQRSLQMKDQNDTLQILLSQIFENSLDYNNLTLHVQGIQVTPEFPTRYLINCLSNPDGFCYIVIK